MQVEVFSGEFWQASLMRQLLAEHDIFAYLGNELLSSIDPVIVSTTVASHVALKVSQADSHRALELIEEYNNSEPIE
ncbi:MAG: hypothetical protein H7223_13915 [Pedobacter sp.]|nr:hypothetical protein [Pedobacter sp.]